MDSGGRVDCAPTREADLNRITGRLTVTTCVLTAIWVCGCGSGNMAPGPNVPLDTVREECSTLKVPQLREKVIAYRDLIRKVLKDEYELDQRIAAAQSESADQEAIGKLRADMARLEKTRIDLIDRYKLYIPVLVRNGVNIDDLRIEEQPQAIAPLSNVPAPPAQTRSPR